MERLSAMDASFFFGEDGNSHNDIGMVLVFDGPSMSRQEVVAAVMARIALVPRFRQKIKLAPFAAALPVWIDDTTFDIDHHVFELAAAAPIDPLSAAVSQVMSNQLDHALPLWQIHLVRHLPSDRWALVVRMHHCMVDGVTSMDIVRVLLSDSPAPIAAVEDNWRPEPEPSDAQLIAAAMTDAASDQFRAAQSLSKALWRPPTMPPSADPTAIPTPPPPTPGLPIINSSINGPIGPGRRWAMAEIPLNAVRRASKTFGGTVNDVLLALCAQGFTALLTSRGEPVEGMYLRSMVPVSLRAPGGADAGSAPPGGNEIGAMIVDLPLGRKTIPERLVSIRAQTEAFKKLKNAVPADRIAQGPNFATPAILTMGARASAVAPVLVNTVTSNVPGPQVPLYLSGRRLHRLGACIALWAPLRIAISILSYDGIVSVGVVSDSASIPDSWSVLGAVTDGVPT